MMGDWFSRLEHMKTIENLPFCSLANLHEESEYQHETVLSIIINHY